MILASFHISTTAPRSRGSGRQNLVDSAGAVAEALDMDSNPFEQAQMEIRQWSRFLVFNVKRALALVRAASYHDDGQIGVVVHIRITHAATQEVHRMIEQRAVAVRRGLKLSYEIRKQRYVIGIDLGQLG